MSILAKLVRRAMRNNTRASLSREEREAFQREFEESVAPEIEKIREKRREVR
jgi:hypothetical protein